jgi:hypothetical protein
MACEDEVTPVQERIGSVADEPISKRSTTPAPLAVCRPHQCPRTTCWCPASIRHPGFSSIWPESRASRTRSKTLSAAPRAPCRRSAVIRLPMFGRLHFLTSNQGGNPRWSGVPVRC